MEADSIPPPKKRGEMLIKNSEIAIDNMNPFQNDCLDRKQNIIDLTNLLRTANQPFVLSIEAPWGWGKTTFIKMWKSFLETEKHPSLYFNAWNNDFADDPLIAFISEVKNLIVDIKDGEKLKSVNRALRNTQKIGGAILKKSIPVVLKVATQGIVDDQVLAYFKNGGDEIGEIVEQFAEDRIKAYEQNKNSIVEFKKSLEKLVTEIRKDENEKRPIIFFIDELDRCRPDFALTLLERIKHLFSVDGIVFVLSIDRNQLASSLQPVYGNGIDADGYLRRFIDLRFNLPSPSTEQFCKLLFSKFNIDTFFQERRIAIPNRIDTNENANFEEAFTNLMNKFKFSLRVQEQCMTEISIILRSTGPNNLIYSELLIFLVAIKSYRPNLYNMLQQKDVVDVELILEQVFEILNGGDNFFRYFEPYISANILRNFSNEDEPNIVISKMREIANSTTDDSNITPEQYRARRILEFYVNRNGFFDKRKKIAYLISRIDNVGNFVTS